ncbi:hypothetical protein DKX38_005437 [Salix brachista]|uniref:Protein kinase domain-containing protein n=1 Tax=Salix brachista TaxID=2182728 RepID=A0A5N5MZH2_9ROSI|nr:hypothetical protein DKX38_005437 [Salix brachista]
MIFSKAQWSIYLVCVVDQDVMATVESLQFDLSTIAAATNNFSADKKLGEGGFGGVYKVRNSSRNAYIDDLHSELTLRFT